LAASAWSSVAAQLASRFRASWDGEPSSAVCTAILRPAPADSFIVEAQDDDADDGAMEALDPGVMEDETMCGSPGGNASLRVDGSPAKP
jgi:hypothetical protein